MSRLDALAAEEDSRRYDLVAQCDRLSAAVEDFRFAVDHDRLGAMTALVRRFDAIRDTEQLWNAARLARLSAETSYRNDARRRRLA